MERRAEGASACRPPPMHLLSREPEKTARPSGVLLMSLWTLHTKGSPDEPGQLPGRCTCLCSLGL